mmetsp:Transcript_69525/g.207161  ORF Transcript_69525/g.207161 Transcript_69525/m.207161 type:complete len:303 (-) Transcript_69525:966-1874(-)
MGHPLPAGLARAEFPLGQSGRLCRHGAEVPRLGRLRHGGLRAEPHGRPSGLHAQGRARQAVRAGSEHFQEVHAAMRRLDRRPVWQQELRVRLRGLRRLQTRRLPPLPWQFGVQLRLAALLKQHPPLRHVGPPGPEHGGGEGAEDAVDPPAGAVRDRGHDAPRGCCHDDVPSISGKHPPAHPLAVRGAGVLPGSVADRGSHSRGDDHRCCHRVQLRVEALRQHAGLVLPGVLVEPLLCIQGAPRLWRAVRLGLQVLPLQELSAARQGAALRGQPRLAARPVETPGSARPLLEAANSRVLLGRH